MTYATTINNPVRWFNMLKTIDFKYMTNNLKKLFEEITAKNNQFIVKSNGQNIAVLIPFDDYQRLSELAEEKEQARKRFFEMVDELREYNKDVPFEQIEKDVAQGRRPGRTDSVFGGWKLHAHAELLA